MHARNLDKGMQQLKKQAKKSPNLSLEIGVLSIRFDWSDKAMIPPGFGEGMETGEWG